MAIESIKGLMPSIGASASTPGTAGSPPSKHNISSSGSSSSSAKLAKSPNKLSAADSNTAQNNRSSQDLCSAAPAAVVPNITISASISSIGSPDAALPSAASAPSAPAAEHVACSIGPSPLSAAATPSGSTAASPATSTASTPTASSINLLSGASLSASAAAGGASAAVDQPPELVPMTSGLPSIPGYTFEGLLGTGRHGVVRRAIHDETEMPVAIKILNDEAETDSATLGEISALRRLNHKHVVRLFEVVRTATHSMLVLECLTGGELFEYLVSRGRLSEKESQKFVRQTLEALDYCHGNGVVHRDLKLENLLLDDESNVKITDFGFSNLYNDSEGNLMSTFVGSPSYCAPEIIANERYCGFKADIWSLGVIIFAILTGNLPFQDDDNAVANYSRIDKAEFEIPEHVSPMACDLIRRILRRNPADRLSIKDIWMHPWIADGHAIPIPVSSQATLDVIVHARVLDTMKDLGYDTSTLDNALNHNELSPATATYYLLMDKLAAEKREEEKNAEIRRASAILANLMGGQRRASGSNRNRNFLVRPPRRRGVSMGNHSAFQSSNSGARGSSTNLDDDERPAHMLATPPTRSSRASMPASALKSALAGCRPSPLAVHPMREDSEEGSFNCVTPQPFATDLDSGARTPMSRVQLDACVSRNASTDMTMDISAMAESMLAGSAGVSSSSNNNNNNNNNNRESSSRRSSLVAASHCSSAVSSAAASRRASIMSNSSRRSSRDYSLSRSNSATALDLLDNSSISINDGESGTGTDAAGSKNASPASQHLKSPSRRRDSLQSTSDPLLKLNVLATDQQQPPQQQQKKKSAAVEPIPSRASIEGHTMSGQSSPVVSSPALNRGRANTVASRMLSQAGPLEDAPMMASSDFGDALVFKEKVVRHSPNHMQRDRAFTWAYPEEDDDAPEIFVAAPPPRSRLGAIDRSCTARPEPDECVRKVSSGCLADMGDLTPTGSRERIAFDSTSSRTSTSSSASKMSAVRAAAKAAADKVKQQQQQKMQRKSKQEDDADNEGVGAITEYRKALDLNRFTRAASDGHAPEGYDDVMRRMAAIRNSSTKSCPGLDDGMAGSEQTADNVDDDDERMSQSMTSAQMRRTRWSSSRAFSEQLTPSSNAEAVQESRQTVKRVHHLQHAGGESDTDADILDDDMLLSAAGDERERWRHSSAITSDDLERLQNAVQMQGAGRARSQSTKAMPTRRARARMSVAPLLENVSEDSVLDTGCDEGLANTVLVADSTSSSFSGPCNGRPSEGAEAGGAGAAGAAASAPAASGGMSSVLSARNARSSSQTLDMAQTVRRFGASTTSSLPAPVIMEELVRTLKLENVGYMVTDDFKVLCESRISAGWKRSRSSGGGPMPSRPELSRRRSSLGNEDLIMWEMEICLIPQLALHGIRMRRTMGDPWVYKSKIRSIVEKLLI